METQLNVRGGKLYYGENQIGDSEASPGFNQYIFDDEPLGKGANGITFSVTHRILKVRQVIKIYFPKENEKDILKKAREESIKNANTILAGIIAVTFDAGEYIYPCRLWYSVMESVSSYCTIKEWRSRRNTYFPTNQKKFDIENEFCKSSIHTSINLAAGLLKAVICLYEKDIIHGDLNPGNILWIMEDASIEESLKKYASYSYSILGELCPYNVKLIDMGASKANDSKETGICRDSYKLYEHMRSFLSPLFYDRNNRVDEWLNFKIYENEKLSECGVNKICGVILDDEKFYYILPKELAWDFFRLVCVLTIAFGIISNCSNKKEGPIILEQKDKSDFFTLMYEMNFSVAIEAISFDSMITLQKIKKLNSRGWLINWKKVWDSYPFNRINITPVLNAKEKNDLYY